MGKKQAVFFTMVMFPDGWKRVGNAYATRKAAQSWLPFIRKRFHGLRAKVSQFTVRYNEDGSISEKSAKILDEKYNLDA